MQPKYGMASLCDKSVDRQTHKQINGWTDRQKINTEGPQTISNDIHYLNTEILGAPIYV